MRTVDVARLAGCSVQQVRKLEAAGALPRAERSGSGYRRYTETHVACLLAYQELTKGVGPVEARRLLCDANTDAAALLARLDAAHAALHQERRELALAREAIQAITAEPLSDMQPSDAMSVGELADALGVRSSTLRHWESEGLLAPARTRYGSRSYRPVDVRDARLVHQLRRAGYRIEPLRELLPQLRGEGGWDARLSEREHSILTRSAALLRGTAALQEALRGRGDLFCHW